MQYFEKLNLAFFHIPKTGGTSFRTFLETQLGNSVRFGRKNLRHDPLPIKIDLMGKDLFSKTYVITLIRNPYATVVSYYTWINSSYLSKNGALKSEVAKKFPWIQEVYGEPFDKFVDSYIKMEKSYAEYLLIDGKLPKNIHMIRLEKLENEAHEILNVDLNLKMQIKQIPHIYKTNHRPFMEYYKNKKNLLDKVTEKYNWIFNENFYDII